MNICLLMFGAKLACGSFWCKNVIDRVPDHWYELNHGDSGGRKVGIVVLWTITLPVLFWTAGTFWSFFRLFAPTVASGPC
jgi:hypothetical protein